MKKYIIIISLLLLVVMMSQQAFAVSEAAVLFLMISPGARAAGMGEAFVAVADDASAVYWNPAGLAYQQKREITFMHVNWLSGLTDDLFYEFLAYRMSIEGVGTIGFNVIFLDLGEQQGMDEQGNETTKFSSNEYAISASYGATVTDNLAMGVSLRYIRSNLSQSGAGAEKGSGQASAFAFDIGLLYKFPFLREKLTFGMNISNMGPKIAYIDAAQADPLPTNLKAGFAFRLINQKYNKLTIAADINKLLVTPHGDKPADPFYQALITSWYDEPFDREMDKITQSIGLEYVYNNLIGLRGGYYHDKEGKVKYLTFGAGIKYHLYSFDFGYVSASEGHPLANTMRFSLSFGF
ncbi:type IX secretion system outer membrane channel protein PorV [candidate division KSB1 bacterium]|nr:type IX secretion system outer membrane channel protein PorV [candidate division KSB1 bacterium]MBL7094051.1 type IX secretion system outer membrane channel protein PorV [candidate division KSB1 bacterium]